jgi:outer membrane protein assembly factor BamB
VTGTLRALDQSGAEQWSLDQRATRLLPLPGGGVAVQQADQLIGLAPTADRLWAVPLSGAIFDYVLERDRILLTTTGDQAALYALEAGQLTQLAEISGKIALSRERVFVYNPTGLYGLNEDAVELMLPLDDARFADGQVVTADDGTLLVAHRGYSDRRLIALNPDGSRRWDRSVQGLGRSLPQLVKLGRQVYAVTSTGDVLLIDLATGESRRVFDGGGLTFLSGQPWAQVLPNGRLAFDFRGGRLIVLDPRAALPVVEVEQ